MKKLLLAVLFFLQIFSITAQDLNLCQTSNTSGIYGAYSRFGYLGIVLVANIPLF